MVNYLQKNLKHAIVVGVATFFSAILIIIGSDFFLNKITSLFVTFVFLLIIIQVGIIFDIIGVAVAAATEPSLHARATKKQAGAIQAIALVRNADRVASFSSDVVGDIAGTVSGAIGVGIIFRLVTINSSFDIFFFGAVMTGIVAALTVTGKAFGKTIAISEANNIIFLVGKVLYVIEKKLGIVIVQKVNRKKRR